jgi:hypothetical protein
MMVSNKTGVSDKGAQHPDERQIPYTLGKNLFGRYGSGRRDGSTHRKQAIRKKLGMKHCHR